MKRNFKHGNRKLKMRNTEPTKILCFFYLRGGLSLRHPGYVLYNFLGLDTEIQNYVLYQLKMKRRV